MKMTLAYAMDQSERVTIGKKSRNTHTLKATKLRRPARTGAPTPMNPELVQMAAYMGQDFESADFLKNPGAIAGPTDIHQALPPPAQRRNELPRQGPVVEVGSYEDRQYKSVKTGGFPAQRTTQHSGMLSHLKNRRNRS